MTATGSSDAPAPASRDEEPDVQSALGRLGPGDIAPDFSLLDDTGATVALSQFRGRRVVLYFYPAAGTPGCTTQACDFQESLSTLSHAQVAVVGISPDEPPALARFRAEQNLTFPLLSDPARAVLLAYGAYGEKTLYGKKAEGVIRSTIIVGPDGRVENAFYHVKAAGHVAKILRELDLAS